MADVGAETDVLFIGQLAPVRIAGSGARSMTTRIGRGKRNQAYGLEELESEWLSHQLEWRPSA